MEPERRDVARDYAVDQFVDVRAAAQFKALGHPLRHQLLGLLLQRAATIGQLADALGCLKGTVSHHMKVLREAGLAQVVRTRRVRGGTEQYWGRTGLLVRLADVPDVDGRAIVLDLVRADLGPNEAGAPGTFGMRRARLLPGQVEAFAERLDALVEEFESLDAPGGLVHGLVVGLYRSNLPTLPDPIPDLEEPT